MGRYQAEQPTYRKEGIRPALMVRSAGAAEVIAGKILEGYRHDGGAGPDLELAGLYVEQFPEGDLSREISRKHKPA